MSDWTEERLKQGVFKYSTLSGATKEAVAAAVRQYCSWQEYMDQAAFTERAVSNTKASRELLNTVKQEYPQTVPEENIPAAVESLREYGVLIMAGGEGERLRQSLINEGANPDDLQDFTKATYPLPGLDRPWGALQVNLHVLSRMSPNIPVIVTTGPAGTTTARVIPEIIRKNNNFGLKNLRIIAQNERLHLTRDRQIAWEQTESGIRIVTNPDETGGPIMKLREKDDAGRSTLEYLRRLGCSRIIVLQGTAVYRREMLLHMAAAGNRFDAMGIGIERTTFGENDPYGTFILANDGNREVLRIIEKDVRNRQTRDMTNDAGKHLPFNTGFYVFRRDLLEHTPLPEYAVSGKTVLAGIPKAPKTGYAATDVLGLTETSGVLTVNPESFSVIKRSEDLAAVAEAIQRYGLIE
ncbi:MAG: hypothetical protein ACQEQV_08820 [Fibrobacterota bacterium]